MNVLNFFDPDRWMPKQSETPLEYWLSLSPAAPLFGVEWRFEDAQRRARRAPAHPRTDKAARVATPEAGKSEAAAVASAPAAEVKAPAAEVKASAGRFGPDAPAGLLASPPAQCDDLRLIKGIGPKLQAELNELGIYTFRQIAAFDDRDLEWIDARLNSFKGRPMRDDWIGQAKALIAD
ncbi:MAG: hypothetical protein D6754_17340 [Alphaproteobacteria bacterium]|nr:MAG: hypothetical protein D6754_17340 [Alphaproteobacteria bacterium]